MSCTWTQITNDVELLNGWQLSGYHVRVTEHSVPFVPFTSESQANVSTAVFSYGFGPLQPGREYKVSVAGMVENRIGVPAEMCIRTRERGETFLICSTRPNL